MLIGKHDFLTVPVISMGNDLSILLELKIKTGIINPLKNDFSVAVHFFHTTCGFLTSTQIPACIQTSLHKVPTILANFFHN
jgi:hypothetical protein